MKNTIAWAFNISVIAKRPKHFSRKEYAKSFEINLSIVLKIFSTISGANLESTYDIFKPIVRKQRHWKRLMELLKMPTMLSLSIVRTSIKVILIALLYWSVHQKATPVNVSNACLFVIALQLSVLGTVVRFSVSMVLTSKRNTILFANL